MKRNLLLIVFLLPLCFGFSKPKYTYYVKQQSPLDTAFVYPNSEYIYNVLVKEQFNGPFNSTFKATLENGTFDNGQTTMDNISLNLNLKVKWNDLSSTYGKITIAVSNQDTAVQLVKGKNEMTELIASLKGQNPSLTVSTVPVLGNTTQFTAQVADIVYPGIYIKNIYDIVVNKTVNKFEWTLPNNWKTTDNKTGTFTTDVDVKQIAVIPDYVTTGIIKVRGVNDVGSAYSEMASQSFDRGFTFTTYPAYINFGDNTTSTFATTLFSGLTYEWSAPAGWKINGQGNTLQGLNLNSVSITPSFCSLTDGKIKVRLIKDTDISDWKQCPYQAVAQPTIILGTPNVYQYEIANFSVSNILPANISSITWSGDGVSVPYNQGTGAQIIFTKSGTIVLYASIIMNGCSSPIVISKVVTVATNRLSESWPTEICSQANFTINNLPVGNTVNWYATPSLVSYPTFGYPITITKTGSGKITLYAFINNVYTISKTITVGAPFYLGVSNISNLTMWDAGDFQVLPGTGYYAYEGTLSVADGVGLATSYLWSFVSATPGKPITWWSSGSMVDVAMKASNTTILLKCTATNYCGSYSQFYSFTNGSIVPLLLAPNPSSTQVEVSIPDAAATNSFMSTSMLASTENLSAVSYSVTVVDSYGLTVYTARVKDNKFKIPTLSFRNGIYSIVVSDGTNVYQNKLIVKH